MAVNPTWDETKVEIIPKSEFKPAMKIMGYNYTDDEKLFGYWPVYVGRPDQTEEMFDNGQWDKSDIVKKFSDGDVSIVEIKTSGVARQLVKSFENREHANGMEITLPIDEGHKSLTGDQKSFGEIVDVKAFEGTKFSVDMNELPEGSVSVMAKIAWYQHEVENIKNGKYGKRASVVFDLDGVFLNIALCQLPAVRDVPTVLVKSEDKKLLKKNGEIDLKFKEEKMADEKNAIQLAIDKHKKKVEDPTILDNLVDALMGLGMTEADVQIIGGISDEGASLLINALASNDAPAEETTEETTEIMLTEDKVKTIVAAAVKAKTEELEKKFTQVPQLKKKTLEVPKTPKVEELKSKYMSEGLSSKDAAIKAVREVERLKEEQNG